MARLPDSISLNKTLPAPEDQLAEVISNALSPARGLRVILDGKIHRFAIAGEKCSDKDGAGWYVGHPDGIPAGAFGSWKDDVKFKWMADVEYEITPELRAESEKRVAELQALAEAERQKERALAANTVKLMLANAKPATPEHEYLKRKQVGAYGLYETGEENGCLIMPIYKDGEIVSAQFIAPDGSKLFQSGGEVKGGYFVVGDKPTKTIYIAEGYATAASIYEATQQTTVVALNAGNLPNVAKWLREKFGLEQRLVIVGDNDESGTGQKAAAEAARVSGARVVIPPNVGDANDYAVAGGDLKALLEPKAWLISADEFRRKPAPQAWLIDGWLQRGGFAMIFGESGCGKTFVALDWFLRIASNINEWAGREVKHGGVVYLAGEGHYGMKARIEGWCQYHKVEHLNMWVSLSACDLNTQAGLQQTIQEIKDTESDIAVIVIDTLHRFLNGDENKAMDVKTMLDACATLSRTFGDCAVALVHHTGVNPDARDRARGSSAWKGALDNQIFVASPKDNTINVKQLKNKDGELAEPVYLERIPVQLSGWFKENGEPISTLVLEPTENGENEDGLTDAQRFGMRTYIQAAEEYGTLDENGKFAGVHKKKWHDVFYAESGDKSPVTKRQNFYLARKQLVEIGRLSLNGEMYQLLDDGDWLMPFTKAQIQKKLTARVKA